MKTHAHRLEEMQDRRIEADLEATINALFRRCPTLWGFSVRETTDLPPDRYARKVSALSLTEVSVYPLCGLDPPPELCSEIVSALVELLDECPGVCELLPGRTFARVFH
jgi:hypothetical protein